MRTELRKYIKIFWKRIWIIILIPSIAITVAWYLSEYFLVPVYESNVSLMVVNDPSSDDENNSALEYYNLLVGKQLVKDYEEIIKSRTVTDKVINELKMTDMTASELAKKITVESKNETSIIEIRVKGRTPEEAQKIADKVSEVFEEKVFQLFNDRNVKIIDSANLPNDFIFPRVKMNIFLAAFGGLLIAFITLLAVEYLDDSIKSTEELERKLGLSVLGIIPDLKIK